jgi:hypothetical protein
MMVEFEGEKERAGGLKLKGLLRKSKGSDHHGRQPTSNFRM